MIFQTCMNTKSACKYMFDPSLLKVTQNEPQVLDFQSLIGKHIMVRFKRNGNQTVAGYEIYPGGTLTRTVNGWTSHMYKNHSGC